MNTVAPTTGETVYQCGTGEDKADPCVACAPKMVLTHEEEAILKTMRELKARARPVSERLKELDPALKSPADALDKEARQEELTELLTQLEGLRTQWRQWEQRLDEAIERKLIALGHREPQS